MKKSILFKLRSLIFNVRFRSLLKTDEGQKTLINSYDLDRFSYIADYGCSEEVQKFAVLKNGYFLSCIDNPSDDVIRTAIRNRSFETIRFVENQKEEFQLLALETSILSFKYIKNPTKNAVKYFIEHIEEGIEIINSIPFRTAKQYIDTRKFLEIMETTIEELIEKVDDDILKLKLEML